MGDAELLIDIYNAAFYDDFVRYGECPAYGRTIERMRQSIEMMPKLIISADGEAVGCVSLRDDGDGKYYIGCLCVVPSYQHKGIGTAVVEYIKQLYKDWREFYLVTPSDKSENIAFYASLGFVSYGTEISGNVTLTKLRLINDTCGNGVT